MGTAVVVVTHPGTWDRATGRPRFEYNYSDPSHPDSKSLTLNVFHCRNQVVMLRVQRSSFVDAS